MTKRNKVAAQGKKQKVSSSLPSVLSNSYNMASL